jgi:hypothetical protein
MIMVTSSLEGHIYYLLDKPITEFGFSSSSQVSCPSQQGNELSF